MEEHGIIVAATLSNNAADYQALKELAEQWRKTPGKGLSPF
ncbi:MAG: hypothetical protein ACPLOU_07155 [bacterium]